MIIYDFENCAHLGFPDIVTDDEVKEAVKEDWLSSQVAHH